MSVKSRVIVTLNAFRISTSAILCVGWITSHFLPY